MTSNQDALKRVVGRRAIDDYVKSDMLVGLGTGSTAFFAVERLGEKLASGELTNVMAIPTSERTRAQAEGLGIPLCTLDERSGIDVAIDGADEVAGNLDLVKGRGGALLREKLVAEGAKLFVCIVDESKIQKHGGLGTDGAMPVEVTQFCWQYTTTKLQALPSLKGCRAERRKDQNGQPYVTDNHNYIVDLFFDQPIEDPKQAAKEIVECVGVVEHGLFLGMAQMCLVAKVDGTVDLLSR